MALDLHDVRKTFPGFALGPVSLTLEPGVVYGLLGPNGAGKTTLLNLIGQQLKLTEGSITHQGQPIVWGDPTWKTRLAYIRETPSLYDGLTVAGSLTLARRLCPTWDAALAAHLCDRLRLDPAKVVGTLSKGTRVKLGLVIGLARRADVVMCDEPTAGVDPSAREEFHTAIHDLRRDHPALTVLLSSHIFEDIDAVSDAIVVLREGRIALRCTMRDLVEARVFRVTAASADPMPDALIVWTKAGVTRALVRHPSDLAARLSASMDHVEEPNVDPLATAYHATGHVTTVLEGRR